MSFVAVFMTVFSVIGAIDLIIGNKFGLGKEFQKGFKLFGDLALSMIGMIVLAPVIGGLLQPISAFLYNVFGIDPSIIPSMLLTSDMGGGAISLAVCEDETIGYFNGLIVASMMGFTLSFTIPYSLSVTNEKIQKYVLFGLLCGIVTIPIGCFVAGVIIGLNIWTLLLNIFPLIISSTLIALGLKFFTNLSVKILDFVGKIIKILIIFGLVLGILKFTVGIEPIKNIDSLENGAMICLNASVVMTGAFPLLHLLSKILSKPLKIFGDKLNVNSDSILGLLSSLAASITTFNNMKNMDNKGIVMNSAFAVSAAFLFADHLAFTMSMNSEYILPMVVGKVVSGITALILSLALFHKVYGNENK